MEVSSRRTIHAGVNFIIAPLPNLDINTRLDFQRRLDEINIDPSEFKFEGNRLVAARTAPMPLNIVVGTVGPQIGQLLIVAPDLGTRSLGVVGAEANDIAQVFSSLWPNRQIVAADTTIRDLYDSSRDHAFQEIWESLLRQSSESLLAFHRPVLGGGLRFVMPPTAENPNEPLIEVKIESFLNNTRKFFVETQCKWTVPQPPGTSLDPETRLEFADNFIQIEVMNFIVGG
jgi:hypothetical protein